MSDQPPHWTFIERALTGLPGRTAGTDPGATRLMLSLNRASGVITYDLEASIHRPRGRTWAAYRLMFVLWLSGEIESKEVARLTGQSRAATSNLSGPLVEAGIVRKRPDPSDGRGVLLSLTERGLEEILEVYALQNAREREWTAALSPGERGTLLMLLEKLLNPNFVVRERD